MDVITVCSFTISGLQQGIDKIAKFLHELKPKLYPLPTHPKSDDCQEREEKLKKNDS
jgi:hypothetical protein